MIPDKVTNRRNWQLFVRGQRHKFLVTEFKSLDLADKHYHYIWQTAQDVDGKQQKDSSQFRQKDPVTKISQVNYAHYQLGYYQKNLTKIVFLQPGALPKEIRKVEPEPEPVGCPTPIPPVNIGQPDAGQQINPLIID